MNIVNVQYHQSKIGNLIIGTYDGKLCLLDFYNRKMRDTVDHRIKKALAADFEVKDHSLINETIKQLDEYFSGQRIVFDLPLLMLGTVFQKSVWSALLKVPYGVTTGYLNLSKAINNEKAVRAVASANAANAIAIIIPCHRIIGSDGKLVGYGGGLHVKEQLLKLEQHYSS